jgi:hypothetical protein
MQAAADLGVACADLAYCGGMPWAATEACLALACTLPLAGRFGCLVAKAAGNHASGLERTDRAENA